MSPRALWIPFYTDQVGLSVVDGWEADSSYARWTGEPPPAPYRHPRGHYGFVAPGPAGVNIMVWSEK